MKKEQFEKLADILHTEGIIGIENHYRKREKRLLWFYFICLVISTSYSIYLNFQRNEQIEEDRKQTIEVACDFIIKQMNYEKDSLETFYIETSEQFMNDVRNEAFNDKELVKRNIPKKYGKEIK
jgi:hypothetical protein